MVSQADPCKDLKQRWKNWVILPRILKLHFGVKRGRKENSIRENRRQENEEWIANSMFKSKEIKDKIEWKIRKERRLDG